MSPRIRLCLWTAPVLMIAMTVGCSQQREPAATRTPDPRMEPQPATVNERLAAAEAATTRGEYQTALALFRGILAQNPTMAVAYVGIGEVYMAQGEYERAEPVLERAARLEPRNFEAQYRHGMVLQTLNRLVDAVRAYHRALTIRPESVDVNSRLAETYLQLDEPDSALVFAEKVVEFDPADGQGRANLGSVYQSMGRNAEAIRQYEAAVELIVPSNELLLNYVNALVAEKRYVDARNTAEHINRLEPDADAWERIGYCSFRLGEYDRSLDAYRAAVQLDPEHWPALNGVGCNALNTWLLGGKSDPAAIREARTALRRSLQVNPDQRKVIALLSQYGV